MSDWENLEELVKELLSYDRPVRTPLSGGTKNEEDVVGINSVSQCKFTSDKNISILAKDLQRLIDAAKLQMKFPIFINQSQAGTTVAFPLNSETEKTVDQALKLVCLRQGLAGVKKLIQWAQTPIELKQVRKELRRLKKIRLELSQDLSTQIDSLDQVLDVKEIDAITYDLFKDNGDSNGT